MKPNLVSFLAVAALLAAAGVLWAEAKRKPLPRPAISGKIEHAATGGYVRVNPDTGEDEEYPLEAEIRVDPKSGNFLVGWNGTDGKRKRLIWEVPWNVDAVVAAQVERDPDGRLYRYTYTLQSLSTSLAKLQSLFLEVRARVDDVAAPDDTWYSREASEFLRKRFGFVSGRAWSQTERGFVGLPPGHKATGFSYTSAALPGIVKCLVRAHQKGHTAGEEMPGLLADAIVKHGWMVPQGFTIGPDERLGKMTAKERLTYLAENLPKMLEAGWIENKKVMQWYKENLLAGKTAEVRARAEADFKQNRITGEVLALMTHLTK